MNCTVTYTKITPQSTSYIWDTHFHSLPDACQQYILQFKHHKDRLDRLVGRLLVRNALIQKGFPHDCLQHILLDQNSRPYINKNIDFNISHSWDIVVCAIAENCRIGIDTEKITTVKFSDYTDFLSPQQLQEINNSKDPYRKFFDFWTIQESILKTDGRGLTVYQKNFQAQPCKFTLNGCDYYYQKLNISHNHSSHLSATKKIDNLTISENNWVGSNNEMGRVSTVVPKNWTMC